MTVGRSIRGPVRIRRRGRHAAPSQVEKVAQQAGKAAPTVALAGALVAAPQVSHTLGASAKPVSVSAAGHQTAATAANGDAEAPSTKTHSTALDSVVTRTVTVSAARLARHAAMAQATTYRVHSGDTLSTIANRFFHSNNDWQFLYHANAKTISDPNAIHVGQTLLIPASVPAHDTLSGYVPRHAKPADSAESANSGQGSRSGAAVTQSAAQGQYSCSGLEQIWEQAGGSPAEALMAAEIAMAESGGNPNAISPTDDFGLWQINGSNGALATLDPFQNAKSAVMLSDDGANWNPWTTFTSGAYAGRC